MNYHISSTVNRHGNAVGKKRRKLSEIDAIHNLLMSVVDQQRRHYEFHSGQPFTFHNEVTENVTYEYFKFKLDSVDYLRKELEKKLPQLKDIYKERRDESNEKNSVRLQLVGIFLALVTLFQAFTQCSLVRESASEKSKKKQNTFQVLGVLLEEVASII